MSIAAHSKINIFRNKLSGINAIQADTWGEISKRCTTHRLTDKHIHTDIQAHKHKHRHLGHESAIAHAKRTDETYLTKEDSFRL
jgi:hypothetical protein